jgi:hypothetical protein
MKKKLCEDDSDYKYEFEPPSLNERLVVSGQSASQVKRGAKGVLSTNNDHPRRVKPKNQPYFTFEQCIGDAEVADRLLCSYKHDMEHGYEVQAEGRLQTCLDFNVPCRVIKDVFKVGSGRLQRVKDKRPKGVANGNNGREVSEEMLKEFQQFVNAIPVEEGYPCTNRRMKCYGVGEAYSSWVKVFQKYLEFNGDSGLRKMAQTTFMRYVHHSVRGKVSVLHMHPTMLSSYSY